MDFRVFKFGTVSLVITLLLVSQVYASAVLEAPSASVDNASVEVVSVEPYSFSQDVLLPILDKYNQPDLKANLENNVISYEQCLTSLKERMPGQDLYSYTADWISYVEVNWRQIFGAYGFFNGDKVVKALEIGSWQGRSACWMLQNVLLNGASEIHAIDTFGGSMEHTDGNENALLFNRFSHNVYVANGQEKCFPYKGKSCDVLRGMQADFKEYFDFMYIDGSHIAADVLNDGLLAFPLLKKGGLMFFDDYEWSGYPVIYEDPALCPKLGVDRFMELYKDQIKVIKIAYQVYLQKL